MRLAVLFLALCLLPVPAWAGKFDDKACFWGTLKATAQLAEKLCPAIELETSAADALLTFQKHRAFVACHNKRRDALLAKRAAVKANPEAFCAEARQAKTLNDGDAFRAKPVIAAFDGDSTIDDWRYGTDEARVTYLRRIAPIIVKPGEEPARTVVRVTMCLFGMSRDTPDVPASVNDMIGRSVSLNEAAALCAVMD